MKKTASKSYALRIDAQLVKPLQDLKKHHRRSLNAEINAAIEGWIEFANQPQAAAETASSAPDGAPDKQKRSKGKLKARAEATEAVGAAALGQADDSSAPT